MPKPVGVVKWDGDVIAGLTEEQVKRGIRDATLTLLRDAKLLIGVKGALIRKTRTGREIREPSLPGEPPHRQTGQLVSSVGHEFEDEGLVGIVGTNVKHGKWTEFGTSKMPPRPWLRPSFDKLVSDGERFFGNSPF